MAVGEEELILSCLGLEPIPWLAAFSVGARLHRGRGS